MAFEPVWALGLMSGTSMDGVDAALIRTDGETVAEAGPSAFLAPGPGETEALEAVAADPLPHRSAADGPLAARREAARRESLVLHARAAAELLARAGPGIAGATRILGYHGQTLAHAPAEGWTWQLADAPALAAALGRPVAWDFRSADVAAGGQGAPLAPFFHFAVARAAGPGPVAVLNLGGVGNVTWVDTTAPAPEAPGALAAFDTGPGNALLDDWMRQRTGAARDTDGAAARAGIAAMGGRVPDTLAPGSPLGSNAVADFLARPGAKSLDRNAFHGVLARLSGETTERGAAWLAAFTADCVAAAERALPAPPARWLVAGGGRRNPAIMALLAERLAAPVQPVEAVGLDGDMLEAEAFAFLAVRVLRGLPLSAPGTTGSAGPVAGGRIAEPPRG